jgi:hypothetical protein
MLQQLFPKRFKRYLDSSTAETLQEVAKWLLGKGYSRDCAQGHLYRLKQVLERADRFEPRAVVAERRLSELFAHWDNDPLYHGMQQVFRRFLIEHGRFICESRANRFTSLLDRYRDWLLELRGFTPTTVRAHLATVADFLASSLSPDKSLAQLSASDVERYLDAKG